MIIRFLLQLVLLFTVATHANGELSCLVSKERVEYPAGITVYNFTVDGNHDYFVIAQTAEYGQTCILVHNAKCDGQSIGYWINQKTYNEIKNSLGQDAAQAFAKAMKKGIVSPIGQQGIKSLKHKGIVKNGVIYTHEIKILGKNGDYRVFGYFDSSSNHYIFDYFGRGLH